ncbi:MAG: amino acid permease [Pseudomonadales bacterium]
MPDLILVIETIPAYHHNTDLPGPFGNRVTELKRDISATLLVFYGLGTILGAGIYVLTGVVAEKAGLFTPLAFVLAALVASPTAFAYAELSTRFPRSAGEAVYVDEAFGLKVVTGSIGLMVAFVGIVSAATIARGFLGYFNVFIELPAPLVIAAVVLGLGALAAYGILQSVVFATIITLIEIVGLLIVVGTGIDDIDSGIVKQTLTLPAANLASWTGVFAGAFLAFYAFIGFEDIVNVAEETRNTNKALPIAILGSLGIAAILYFLVTMVAVASMPMELLAGHEAPMALMIEQNSQLSPLVLVLISMLAVINGALIQMIMAARVVFGMASLQVVPNYFNHVDPRTRTPLRATILVVTIVLTLAVSFDIETLAGLTSTLTLVIFAAINLALLVLKHRGEPTTGPVYPVMVPIAGLLTSLTLLASSLFL